jgi:hypothetical protein
MKDESGRALYRSFGVPGHRLNEQIFFFTSLGTIAIAFLESQWVLGLIPATIASLLTVIRVRIDEKRIHRHIRHLPRTSLSIATKPTEGEEDTTS